MTNSKGTNPPQTDLDEYYDKIREGLFLATTDKDIEALEATETLLRSYPDGAEVYFLLGLISYKLDDQGRAIEMFEKAHELDPDCREYVDALAVVCTLIGRLADGLYFAKLSTTTEPHAKIQPLLPLELGNYFRALDQVSPPKHFIEAMGAFNLRHFSKSLEKCEKELRINPNNAACFDHLGRCHYELENFGRAVEAHRKAIELEAKNALYHIHLGNALYRLGRFENAISAHKEALDIDRDSVDVATGAMIGAAVLGDEHDDYRKSVQEEVERRVAALPSPDGSAGEAPPPAEKIRVGFLSNRFHGGEIATFIEPVLRYYNRDTMEVYCYQQSIVEDPINVQLKNSPDSWRKIFDLNDEIVARIIQGDEIDVLVDLCGYTENHRHGLIAMKPSPVRICWLSYPHGIDSGRYNFVLSDPVTAESDKRALSNGQESIVLDYGLMALEQFTIMPDVNDVPASSNGYVTFGGRCDLASLGSQTAKMWAKVVKAVPGSWLLLGNVLKICSEAHDQAVELFANHGIANRIKFWEDEDEHRVNPEFYRHIDVFLDTTPVCGTVNLCEAMWMGVPVLTLKEGRRSAQIGASLLGAAAKPEWICESEEQMAEKASALAGDLDKLGEIRSALRGDISKSALFTPQAITQSLEKAFRQALETATAK